MAGGFHSTKPFHHSVALVANVTSKLPSALQSWCTQLNTASCTHSQYEYIYKLGLFGTLKLALALQFIVTNAYFSVARMLTLVLHATLK